MLHPADGLDLGAMTAIAAGCGLGTREAAATLVRDVLAHDAATLLDADALNLVATHADLATAVATRGARGNPVRADAASARSRPVARQRRRPSSATASRPRKRLRFVMRRMSC